jgi:molybdopterin molybdotransferase
VLAAKDRTVVQHVPSHLALGRALSEDVAGHGCLSAGAAIEPPHLAILAQLGVAEIPTYAPTGIGFVTLAAAARDVDDWTAGPAAAALAAATARVDQIAIDLRAAAEDDELHLASISRALDMADIVCTIGAGPPEAALVARRFAGEVVFAGVAQAPGGGLSFASLADGWWFGLPGDPAEALVCFHLYVAPLARKFAGHRLHDLPATPIALADVPPPSQVHRWAWGRSEDGRARLLDAIDEPLCRAEQADGLLLIPPAGSTESALFYRLR